MNIRQNRHYDILDTSTFLKFRCLVNMTYGGQMKKTTDDVIYNSHDDNWIIICVIDVWDSGVI